MSSQIDIITVGDWPNDYKPNQAIITLSGSGSGDVTISLYLNTAALPSDLITTETFTNATSGDFNLSINLLGGQDIQYLKAIVPSGWTITNIQFYLPYPATIVNIIPVNSWALDYRPTQMTISLAGVSVGNSVTINVYDTSSNVIGNWSGAWGGGTDVTIDLDFINNLDIGSISTSLPTFASVSNMQFYLPYPTTVIGIVPVNDWSVGYRSRSLKLSFNDGGNPGYLNVIVYDSIGNVVASVSYVDGVTGGYTIPMTLSNDIGYIKATVPTFWTLTNIQFHEQISVPMDLTVVPDWNVGYRPTKAKITLGSPTMVPGDIELTIYDSEMASAGNVLAYGSFTDATSGDFILDVDFTYTNVISGEVYVPVADDIAYLKASVPQGWTINKIDFYSTQWRDYIPEPPYVP